MPSGAKSRKFSTKNLEKILGKNFKKFKDVKEGMRISYTWLKENYDKRTTRL